MINKKTQRERFEETSRQLECDEDEKRLDATVKKLATAGSDKKPEKKD